MSRFRRLLPVLTLVLALPVLADPKVTALFTAKVNTGDSSIVTFSNANTSDSYAFQVSWTGTAVVTLRASLDGTNWYTVTTWSGAGGTDVASAVIVTAPIIGGLVYKLNQGTCTGCSTTAKVTSSGASQVVVY